MRTREETAVYIEGGERNTGTDQVPQVTITHKVEARADYFPCHGQRSPDVEQEGYGMQAQTLLLGGKFNAGNREHKGKD